LLLANIRITVWGDGWNEEIKKDFG